MRKEVPQNQYVFQTEKEHLLSMKNMKSLQHWLVVGLLTHAI